MEEKVIAETKKNIQSVKDEQKKTLRVFGWASFLNDFGSDMIMPIWPLFLTTVLGVNMTVLGLIDGLSEAMVSISQAVSGYVSDRIKKRKIFIWLGYIFAGVARIGFAFSSTWQAILPFRIIDRSGKMRGAPRDAMIADFSTNQNRGKHFGYLRMMDNAGAVCGVLFTYFFFKYLGYQNTFLLAAIPSLIGAFLVYRFVKEYSPVPDPTPNPSQWEGGNPKDTTVPKKQNSISFSDLSRDLKLYILLSTLFSAASFSYSFLILYANQIGFAVITIPLLYLLYTTVASVVSIPFGKLADRINRKPVLLCSFIFWITSCLLFIFMPNTIGIIIAFIFYGLHLGSIDPVQKAFVSELAVPEFKASTLGIFQMAIGLAALPGSLLAGILWGRFGAVAPFYFSTLLTLCAFFLLLLVKEKAREKTYSNN